MPRRTETWEGCRWTRIDPPVNVVRSEPTDHQLLFSRKWTVVIIQRLPSGIPDFFSAFMSKSFGFDFRFAPTRPPVHWSGVRSAFHPGPVCPQRFPDVSNVSAALEVMPR